METLYNKIEHIQNTSKCYCIDYLPKQMAGERYFELEQYFIKNYINDFSKKIRRIVIKMINYTSAKICITEAPETFPGKWKNLIDESEGKDIAGLAFEELDQIMDYIILKDVSSMQILMDDAVLLSIDGGFNVSLYGEEKDFALLAALVDQEGLFIREAV